MLNRQAMTNYTFENEQDMGKVISDLITDYNKYAE